MVLDSVPDQGGGAGGTPPPPHEEAVSALKINKNAYYMILRVYTVMFNWENTCDLDYLDDNELPTILMKEKVVMGPREGCECDTSF